jgi:hypothetical protein
MPELPSGTITITFLFTDIEGSTVRSHALAPAALLASMNWVPPGLADTP